ncbi:sensor histidine kinase [Labrenzia sp. PHM005]|uniref:sensor histidine kinase n=1 Tax=Labrenzia sp. PHM005 TaxID=2590016 RepID=UPI00113FEA49|nr:sensor histidine kinase [Labrenzia sp. PHM005]QDG75934.1 sensor histidine kinase [Labrenzia sp. PHM005]
MASLLNRLGATSLTARVALGVTFLLAFGGVIVSVAAFAYGREAARSAYDRLLVGAANDIASAIAVVDGSPVLVLPHSAFELLALAPDDRIGYRILGPDGETLTGYDEIVLPDGLTGFQDVFFDAPFFGENARYVVVSRQFAERTWSGTVRIVVGQTLLAREAMAFDITRKALYVLAASGFAMMLLAVLVVRAVFNPLKRIASGLAARDPHDLTPLDTDVPRETAIMIQALNGFMGRLDRQMNSMRHLISDTAHQLRTPVAALRAQADLFSDEKDPERRERVVERIQTRSSSLGRLLDQMLSQALVIHRGDSVRRERVDLRDVVLDVFEDGDHTVLMPHMEVVPTVADHPILVLADATSLQEAVKNLLSNALKYGRAPVRIGATLEGDTASIWVEDSGGGPDPDVLSALGSRFNQAGPIRQNSSGLGLAIAHAVANSFEGRLVLENRQGETFRAALLFPAIKAESS